MMLRRYFIIILLLTAVSASAQKNDDLFGAGAPVATRSGFILNGNGSFDMPGGDMAKRFGVSYRLGPAVLYKTKSNWLFGAKFDFILGNTIKEDSLMMNIKDKYSINEDKVYEFLNNAGQRIGIPVYERGYAVGVNAGRIFAFSKAHPDNGLVVLTTGGFIQHKINIYDKDKSVNQLRGNYLKGYDRLTNGAFVEQYVGYIFFSDSRLINFTIGVDALFGFTQGRRDYLFDVMRPDTKQRVDMLFGLRAGWFIPIFKRRSEDISFE